MLHQTTVEEGTLRLLRSLQSLPFLKDFYLVEGTALALYMGHRKSIDLDLFTPAPFKSEDLERSLREFYPLKTNFSKGDTLLTNIEGVKVDFIYYPYNFISSPTQEEGLRLASKEDIVAMKLSAISQSGQRIKDFIDIAYLSTYYSLEEMLGFYGAKFPNSNPLIPLKALTYFEDIIFENEVIMLRDEYSWDNIASRLINMTRHTDKRFEVPPLQKKSALLEEAEQTLGKDWQQRANDNEDEAPQQSRELKI